jgi:aspartyl-tRNA(Asn)/glutamyl-tRNA(Gln) amidotransferase subunit C
MPADHKPPLSADQVRKVARLSRLAIPDAKIEEYRAKLAAVLGYMERLQELDLSGVEPMTNVAGAVNRFDRDEPGPMLGAEALMKMAPESLPPFIKVPKVLDDGGGA